MVSWSWKRRTRSALRPSRLRACKIGSIGAPISQTCLLRRLLPDAGVSRCCGPAGRRVEAPPGAARRASKVAGWSSYLTRQLPTGCPRAAGAQPPRRRRARLARSRASPIATSRTGKAREPAPLPLPQSRAARARRARKKRSRGERGLDIPIARVKKPPRRAVDDLY